MIRKTYTVLAILIILLLFEIMLVSSTADEEKISQEVYKSLENNSEVRIVVDIKEPAKEEGFLIKREKTEAEIAEEKQEIKEEIINQVGKEDLERIFEDSIAVEISKEDLDKLNKNPDIESVSIDSPIVAFLQDSVPLVNATRTWQVKVSGLNITGIDETICIIDTGINFSHPDLIGKNKTSCLIDCINPTSGCVENCSISDDHGHGTHVAGIAAASGSIKGVAIGAGLIGVKVLDATGSGSGSDLNAGIDWCIANAAAYNISVISMSLGIDCNDIPSRCYNHYCDSEEAESDFAFRIDNATSKNISVIIATGNDYNKTHISSPACVKNATSIGASDKNDNIADYSNRNNMTDLLAPGSSINSTKRTGGYEIRSGTSMATPHVAGAFALIRQFFRLQNNRVPTPLEILAALNSTGKQINDTSGNNLNYSRINIYAAILSLDSATPNVSLSYPANNAINTSINQTFSCNASDLQLTNITFYIWNLNSLFYNETKSITGESSSSVFNLTNLAYDNYKWNCLAYDAKANSAFAVANYSLTIRYLAVGLTYPLNNISTKENQSYNCSAVSQSSKSLANITFYIWNSSSLVYNETKNITGESNSSSFSYNFTNEGDYKWNCKVLNNNSEDVFADSNFTINYDVTFPVFSSISASVTETTAVVGYNTNENTNSSISYGTSSSLGINSSNSTLSLNHSFSLTGLTGSTAYYYNLTSCDRTGNCVTNGTNSFTTSAPVVIQNTGGSGGGGGGGGTGYETYAPTKAEISQGYTKELNKNDRIKFSFFDAKAVEHFLIVNSIKENYANITIRSSPINLVLGIGQSAKLNLSSPDYYDLYIKLEGIENNKAKLTIQLIHEEIPKPAVTGKTIETQNYSEESGKEEIPDNAINLSKEIMNLKILIYVLIAAFIIFILFMLFRKRDMKEEKIKEYKNLFKEHIKPK